MLEDDNDEKTTAGDTAEKIGKALKDDAK